MPGLKALQQHPCGRVKQFHLRQRVYEDVTYRQNTSFTIQERTTSSIHSQSLFLAHKLTYLLRETPYVNANIEEELLAFVFVSKLFHTYGRILIAESDHKHK